MKDLSVLAAGVRTDPSGRNAVAVTLDPAAAARFAAFTKAHVGSPTELRVNGKLVSSPRIMTPITGGEITVSGSFTEAEARSLASALVAPGASIAVRALD